MVLVDPDDGDVVPRLDDLLDGVAARIHLHGLTQFARDIEPVAAFLGGGFGHGARLIRIAVLVVELAVHAALADRGLIALGGNAV